MKIKTNDIESIRQINTVMVLDKLRNADKLLSRPNVADMLGLSKVTISNIIRELNEQGLTTDAGVGSPDSRGGRKPLLVALDRTRKRMLGARMGHNSIELILSDITGHEIKRLKAEPKNQDSHYLLIAMVKDILLSTNTSKEAVLGMVVAVGGKIAESLSSGEGDAGLAAQLLAKLKESLDIPVKLINFTEARAFGERWYAKAGRRPSFFYVNLGHKLDCLLIQKGLIGKWPCEFGDCYLSYLPEETANESRKTVNMVLNGQAVLDKAGALHGQPLTSRELNVLADEGDAAILKALREFGYQLGGALSIVVNLSGVTQIILGGILARSYPHYQEAMNAGLKQYVATQFKEVVEIKIINFDLENGLLGALSMALDNWIYHTEMLCD